MNLEQVVRPFAGRELFSTTRIARNTKQGSSEAKLTWGTAGTVPQAEQIANTETEINFKYCQDEYDETQRSVENVRVENPDDSSQYVIVQRPVTISFGKKKPSYRLNSIHVSSSSLSSTVTLSDNSAELNGVQDNGCNQKYNLKNNG